VRRHSRLLPLCLRAGVLASALIGLTAACGDGSSSSPPTRQGSSSGYVQTWQQEEHLPPAALPGAAVFGTAGCGACHMYAGSGHANLGAPDLTAYGRLHLGTAFDIRFLRCPSCMKSGSPMPAFSTLGKERLRQLAVFLEASKGIR
jgi:mono/diheme cytochrome c family protein